MFVGPNNLIGDGFFDVGQLRPDASLLSIEDYCKKDINQKRPVLLINAQPEYVSSLDISLTYDLNTDKSYIIFTLLIRPPHFIINIPGLYSLLFKLSFFH